MRQKKVFNNQELAHVWASQSQESGRNASDSMFFKGTDIYSYGYHYLMGRIHTASDGSRYAILNDDGYSMTTKKQTSYCWRALYGLMPVFYGNPESPEETLELYAESSVDACFDIFKRNEPSQWDIERAIKAVEKHNELALTIGKPELSMQIPQDLLDIMTEYINERKARKEQLNTPEMIAEREAKAARKAELAAIKAKAERATEIEEFNTGKRRAVNGLSPQIIRVNDRDRTVETSGGAVVPLREAVALLGAIDRGKDLSGRRIGYYTYNGLIQDRTVAVIGCHRIEVAHARSVIYGYLDEFRDEYTHDESTQTIREREQVIREEQGS